MDSYTYKNNFNPGPPRQPRVAPSYFCYICGRQFGSKSISIHEPQCLIKWNIENDKLPKSKRRQAPVKPKAVVGSDGKVDLEATNEIFWENAQKFQVQCEHCGRKFGEDRLEVHQRSCTAENPAKRIEKTTKRVRRSPSVQKKKTNVSNVANYSASSSTDSNASKPKRSRPKGSATKPKKANNKRVLREKSAFSYTDLITLGLLNSPYERANCKTLYNFIGYHFPSIQSLPHAKNSIRHTLTDDKGRFERVPNSSSGCRRDSVYTFGVDSREKMISSVIEKIEANENTMEKLMMRNLWDLPGILAGICPVPEGFVTESHILNVSSEQNNSYSTNNESFESSTYGDDLPEDCLDTEPSTSLDTSYSNQPLPALHDHDYCK